jgi:hypothetical protein
MEEYEIEGHAGVWELKDSYITELGYLMIKFYNRDRGVFMNINTGTNLRDLLVQIGAAKVSDETSTPNLDIIY